MSSDRLRLIDLEVPSGHETEETARSRQFPQKRAQIVAAALKLAGREGIEAVSMRRVAAEVDMGTMTLYSYVAKKQDLFALMGEAIGREVLIDEVPSDWRDAVRAISRREYEVMKRHPWIFRVQVDQFISASFMRHMDQSMQALQGLDVDVDTKMDILRALGNLTQGAVLDDISEEENGGESWDPAWISDLARAEGLDHLVPVIPAMATHRSAFERGLEFLIAGIEATISAEAAPRPAGRRKAKPKG